MSRVFLTVSGAKQLKEELDFLKTRQRPSITAAVAKAREHGDLRENAEYQAAREKQSFCEGRIRGIEGKLATAEVIDVTKVNARGKVVFGATAVIHDLGTDKTLRYRIVGEDEANSDKGFISFSSPVGSALIGHVEGDVVEIKTPGGVRECEILEVLYI